MRERFASLRCYNVILSNFITILSNKFRKFDLVIHNDYCLHTEKRLALFLTDESGQFEVTGIEAVEDSIMT